MRPSLHFEFDSIDEMRNFSEQLPDGTAKTSASVTKSAKKGKLKSAAKTQPKAEDETSDLSLTDDVHPRCIALIQAKDGDKEPFRAILGKFKNKDGKAVRRLSELLPKDYEAIIQTINAEISGEDDSLDDI